MESLFTQVISKLEKAWSWERLTEDEKTRFKDWLIITLRNLNRFIPDDLVDDICYNEDKLTKAVTLLYGFFLAGMGVEATFNEMMNWRPLKESIKAKDHTLCEYFVFHVTSTGLYYKYDRFSFDLTEITIDEATRLLDQGALYEIVLDGYEIKFIINDDKSRCKKLRGLPLD